MNNINKGQGEGDLPLSEVTGIEPDMSPRLSIGELPLDIINQSQEEGSAVAWKDLPPEVRAAYNRNRLAGLAGNGMGTAKIDPQEVDPRFTQLQENKKK